MNLQEQSDRIDELRQEIALAEHEFSEATRLEAEATNSYECQYAKEYLRFRFEKRAVEDSKHSALLETQEARAEMRKQEGLRRAAYSVMENRRKALGAIEALLYARNSEIKMEMSNNG